jgi:TrmH family RNA methyltransferase
MTGILDNLRVVLVGTRNPLNIGAAARAMSNFGAPHLRLVRPYELAFREARSAVGAAELLAGAKEYDSVADAVADCRLVVGTTAAGRRELQLELRRLEVASRTVRNQLNFGPVAVLFGSEKVGLSNADMSHCHWLMRIPTRAEHGSMNLGQAVAVCLYELVRSQRVPEASAPLAPPRATSRAAKKSGRSQAAAGEIERLTHLLYQVLDSSGYVKPRLAAPTLEKLRRMLRRMNLTEADANLWLGMLRQIAWKREPLDKRGLDRNPDNKP